MEPTEWMLTKSERANQRTRVDDRHPGEEAWSYGNRVTPLVHGATYFRELYDELQSVGPGDVVFFVDWQGDPDERLTDDPDSEIAQVLIRARERGGDVRGLIWRSHWEKLNFAAGENRSMGEALQENDAELLLDMRVRTGGSHHQKFVVIRRDEDPARDVAFVGGIDLCHSRRDTIEHQGDPQSLALAHEYGPTPPWHDIQARIQGPAVHDVETVFRERWEDPTALTRHPVYLAQDKLLRLDMTPDPLPPQLPAPPAVGPHVVQLLRTYPNLRHGRDYPFARGGERSVARGYGKAIRRARRLIYVEDQYLWGNNVGELFTTVLTENPGLHLIAVVPRFTDQDSPLARYPQMMGRAIAIDQMLEAAPGRVAIYAPENHQGTPVYVHAKTCHVDDAWCTIGSDNFNRRSWTHDSEITAAIMDTTAEDHNEFSRRLRLTLAAEHLDREVTDETLLDVMADCVEPEGMFHAFAESAQRLEDWHQGGRQGPRPDGRLRPLSQIRLTPWQRLWVRPFLNSVHDPDGRPGPLRRRNAF